MCIRTRIPCMWKKLPDVLQPVKEYAHCLPMYVQNGRQKYNALSWASMNSKPFFSIPQCHMQLLTTTHILIKGWVLVTIACETVRKCWTYVFYNVCSDQFNVKRYYNYAIFVFQKLAMYFLKKHGLSSCWIVHLTSLSVTLHTTHPRYSLPKINLFLLSSNCTVFPSSWATMSFRVSTEVDWRELCCWIIYLVDGSHNIDIHMTLAVRWQDSIKIHHRLQISGDFSRVWTSLSVISAILWLSMHRLRMAGEI